MPKTQQDLENAGLEFIGDFTLFPNFQNYQNLVEAAEAMLVNIENLVDRVSHGELVARIRQEWVDPVLSDEEVEALQDVSGFLYYDKETFPEDGDNAYRVVQSGQNDGVNSLQTFTLNYPTYNKPDYGAGTSFKKSRVTFGRIQVAPVPPV